MNIYYRLRKTRLYRTSNIYWGWGITLMTTGLDEPVKPKFTRSAKGKPCYFFMGFCPILNLQGFTLMCGFSR